MELNVGDSNVVKGAGACWAGEMMMIFWASWGSSKATMDIGLKVVDHKTSGIEVQMSSFLVLLVDHVMCNVMQSHSSVYVCVCLCLCQCVRIYLCVSVCICLCGCWKLTFDQTHLVSFLPQTVRSSPILLQILDNRIQIWQQGMSDKTRSRSTKASIHKYSVNASWPNHKFYIYLKTIVRYIWDCTLHNGPAVN